MRFARGIFRLAFALVFGFTSLAHGPAMTLRAAAAEQPCHNATTAHHAGAHAAPAHDRSAGEVLGHHHAAIQEPGPQSSDNQNGAQKVCPMPGCFLMVAPAPPVERLPATAAGRYEPVLTPFPGALTPDPADPPPRLPA